jgi:hypothetical protein
MDNYRPTRTANKTTKDKTSKNHQSNNKNKEIRTDQQRLFILGYQIQKYLCIYKLQLQQNCIEVKGSGCSSKLMCCKGIKR